MTNKSNNEKNKFMLTIIAVGIIVGMAAFGYQMYEHNSRVVQQISSIDIPDDEPSTEQWIKYTGDNSCPGLIEQRFDANKSHYMCMYHR